jgi:hypothetical protein
MSTTNKLVDEMERIRAGTNVRWMEILRIALREAPEETKAICRDIADRDGQVQGVFREIADS